MHPTEKLFLTWSITVENFIMQATGGTNLVLSNLCIKALGSYVLLYLPYMVISGAIMWHDTTKLIEVQLSERKNQTNQPNLYVRINWKNLYLQYYASRLHNFTGQKDTKDETSKSDGDDGQQAAEVTKPSEALEICAHMEWLCLEYVLPDINVVNLQSQVQKLQAHFCHLDNESCVQTSLDQFWTKTPANMDFSMWYFFCLYATYCIYNTNNRTYLHLDIEKNIALIDHGFLPFCDTIM